MMAYSVKVNSEYLKSDIETYSNFTYWSNDIYWFKKIQNIQNTVESHSHFYS